MKLKTDNMNNNNILIYNMCVNVMEQGCNELQFQGMANNLQYVSKRWSNTGKLKVNNMMEFFFIKCKQEKIYETLG